MVFSFSHTFFQVSINCLESMNIIDCVFGQLCDTYKRSLLFRFSLNAVEIWNESKNVLSLNETPVFSVHEIATHAHAHARAHPSHSWRSLRRKIVQMKNVCAVYTEYSCWVKWFLIQLQFRFEFEFEIEFCAKENGPYTYWWSYSSLYNGTYT